MDDRQKKMRNISGENESLGEPFLSLKLSVQKKSILKSRIVNNAFPVHFRIFLFSLFKDASFEKEN